MAFNDPKKYRFSESPIWELQRAYYEEQGIRAWQNNEVPEYITSNPMIATCYAEIIFGFLQDRANLGSFSEPVTIVELGAGSGRLAFHILKELCTMRDYAGMPLPSFRYVMSDLVLKNITYWQQHPSLRPFVEQGILDFAQFDAVADSELTLTETGIRIRRGDLQQPLLILANYFFDSIPQELIYVDDQTVYDCMVSLHFSDKAAELSASEMLESVTAEYEYRLAADYEQESYPYRNVIAQYTQKLEDSHILFPVSGLQCLERLSLLSSEGFLLITADKGDHRLESWEYSEPPQLIHHGSFSLTANYHALNYVWEQRGARCLFTQHPYHHLNIGCMLMIANPLGYGNTRLAYRRFIERYGPDDFITIKEWLDAYLEQLEVPQFLSFWRLSGYDAQLFLQCSSRLMELLPMAEEGTFSDIRQGILQMWEGYYPMGAQHETAFECAELLYHMEMFQDAIVFYERTDDVYHQNPDALYAMAICYYEVGQFEAARRYAEIILKLVPEHEGALALLELEDQL
ncbi:tetratricopeptide repeat protein [Paenibacillus aceris]|uniref:Tetratricopeptide (TPR) repeat protein n=1 Tax=Paenibacillus aceris TaxID=869555 RepID=A0ABS4I0G3_9BACL|nr:tetratricopeptide repeat protein [Paenibacillus aceris]MBP1964375.1 tetratricopeptide (TPR) repeat protein [Paenibacillus aceris]NHW35909.1 tetratricopeptide repeat protein [Paenibacillus aceris]